MGGPRAARLPVGSAPWVAEERSSASEITQSEIEEFAFSARNEFDWLNEHMADIFSENQINVAEIFKTPGKLRGKTPRTIRKANPTENRVPLSDIFTSTTKGGPNPFIISNTDRDNSPRVQIAADPQTSPARTNIPTSPTKTVPSPKPVASKHVVSIVDSGYHGSQSQDMDVDIADFDEEPTQPFDIEESIRNNHHTAFHVSPQRPKHESPARTSPVPTIANILDDVSTQFFTAHVGAETSSTRQAAALESTTPAGSPNGRPLATSSAKSSPRKSLPPKHASADTEQPEDELDAEENDLEEPSRSASDGSSPIRPIVRKSSLNFASLPAREPITHKSIGNRISRTSHLDLNRTSYYNRQTGGKSLGHARQESTDDENDGDDDDDEMDTDEEPSPQKSHAVVEPDTALAHNKTYTQRLQDQISKLGQPQAKLSRPSKSIPDSTVTQQSSTAVSSQQSQPQRKPVPSPKKPTTPGAFPENDDEDDWIEPLGSPDNASGAFSPRPGMPKSHSADVMEGLTGKETVGGNDFALPKTRQRTSRSKSPERPPVPSKTIGTPGHHKSASVPSLPLMDQADEDNVNTLKKSVSVSYPPLDTVFESERPSTPKSPSRGFRDSPLKQVKNKLSSILKSSKGLLASSAAISAEGKSSLISPSTTRLAMHGAPSMESLRQISTKDSQPLYPDLSRHAIDNQTIASVTSPTRTSPARTEGRRTRASIEREKAEEKRREKEVKETRRAAEQMEKLEKAREKEREKARVFSKEQDRVAALERQVSSQKEQEKKTVPPTPQPPKTIRKSPRKTKAQLEAEEKAAATAAAAVAAAASDDQPTDDIDMVNAPNTMPPPSVPRAAPPASATKPRELKRPMKPAKELPVKTKQAPTVIRVNMNSQNSQHHPSNSALASNLQETLSSSISQPQLKSKGQQSVQGKHSLQSLKSSSSSTGRPKALEMAARRKEQEEREAQRKRDAKAEMERKRTAMQEEERRQEQQRKLDTERQKEEERKQADAKKNAQRQAMLEKAKQTRAPPPAVRNQPNGPPEYQAQKGDARPPSRMTSGAPPRSQEELGRPVNATLSGTTKAAGKRPLQQDETAEKAARQAPSRPGTAYQTKESKRMRMTDEFDDLPPANQSSLKGAPIRPSGGYKKDVPSKPMFPSGYTNAPPPSATRDLFKTTVTNQHNSHIKAKNPMDMAQFSKGAIPFAPNPNPAGPSAHKTPARPQGGVAGVKSTAKKTPATRSSPRFQNGESIELPEINTDDEDSDSDSDNGGGNGNGGKKDLMAAWADSPELRRALVEQEAKDPFQIFGAPAPLNMEEVFAKSKDRFHKFRARTSSANWSGHDRLTEDDIRRDLQARDRMRREGGWSYEMSKELA